jgi:hypothetical protein
LISKTKKIIRTSKGKRSDAVEIDLTSSLLLEVLGPDSSFPAIYSLLDLIIEYDEVSFFWYITVPTVMGEVRIPLFADERFAVRAFRELNEALFLDQLEA